MNLHRAGVEGEWQLIPESDWNIHQRLAEASNGVLTIANAITLSGGILVYAGIKDLEDQKLVSGMFKIGVGRFEDILDGYLSDLFGTKGPVGEGADAGMDSIVTLYAAYKLAKLGVIPRQLAIGLGGQQLFNMGMTGLAKKRGNEIHTGLIGKSSHAAKWASVGLHTVGYVAENIDKSEVVSSLHQQDFHSMANVFEQTDLENVAETSRRLANGVGVGALASGAAASVSYAAQALI